jgi:hypothetical protein
VGAFLPSFHHLSSLFIVRPREGATVVVPPSARLTTQKKQQLEREKEREKKKLSAPFASSLLSSNVASHTPFRL